MEWLLTKQHLEEIEMVIFEIISNGKVMGCTFYDKSGDLIEWKCDSCLLKTSKYCLIENKDNEIYVMEDIYNE